MHGHAKQASDISNRCVMRVLKSTMWLLFLFSQLVAMLA
jgi:hypothetical protein